MRNFARRTRTPPLAAATIALLDALASWQSEEDLRQRLPTTTVEQLTASLALLVAHGVVECTGTEENPVDVALRRWADWGTSAAFFHLDTKDVAFVDRSSNGDRADRRLLIDPPPDRDEGPISIVLPAYPQRGAFPEVLLRRRSWRRFGRRALTLPEIATVLGLTWGTQRWMHLRKNLACPLKTSPSGGASHSLEVYMVARDVGDLAPGVYRYASDAHGLARIDDLWPADRVVESLGGQQWTSAASAVFFMTAVFPRIQWKYKFARAYRALLLEAGHFCQTFCLVSTWLKLAPFCTAALADTMIERNLGIDGVTESVIYAMGIGPRPGRLSWAPWPDDDPLPDTTAPTHQRRRRVRAAARRSQQRRRNGR